MFKQLIKKTIIIVFIILLTSCTNNPYFKRGDEYYDVMDNLIYVQKETDKRIEKELVNKRNTFDNPLIIENPYYITPLTAIIIFNTEEETSVKVTINNSSPLIFEKAKEHAIPIYGLYDDYDNKIVIKDDNDNTKEIIIKTEKYNGGVIDVKISSDNLSNEFYFVSPDYERTSIYEKEGKLLWYLDTPDNEGAVVFLGDDRFLISDPYQGSVGIRINYSGFMEMDYLGKIHKIYLGEYGYHHEILRIKDNKSFLLPGSDDESEYKQAVVYEVDAQTMEVLNKIDFYDIFLKHSPEWANSLIEDGLFNLVINGIDYDEESGDVIVSIRITGMLVRINLETSEIKWIFADPNNVPVEMQKYLLKPIDDTRYPYGQHNPLFLENNLIAYHNNDMDFMHPKYKLVDMLDRYSSNEILEIDEENKTVKTIWTYDGDKKILSRMSGSLEFFENGNKLISYGSAMKEEAYNNATQVDVTDFDYTEAIMMELDENDNVLWKATFPSVIHKVYRSTFYGNKKVLDNYKVDALEIIDGQDSNKHTGDVVDINGFDLRNAEKFAGYFTFKLNRALVTYDYKLEDEIKILFVSEDGKGRIFDFKEKNKNLPIINSGQYGIRINGLIGKQKVYISVNDHWYDTGKVIDFDMK